MLVSRTEALYATFGTARKFWQSWRDDEDSENDIALAANRLLAPAEKDAIFSGAFDSARRFFDDVQNGGERAVTEQHRLLYASWMGRGGMLQKISACQTTSRS